MSKFIFVLKSGIKCHFGGFLISPCPLTPQRHNARIGFLVTLEIGDMQAYYGDLATGKALETIFVSRQAGYLTLFSKAAVRHKRRDLGRASTSLELLRTKVRYVYNSSTQFKSILKELIHT